MLLATCRIKIRQQLRNKSMAAMKAIILAEKEPSKIGEARTGWGKIRTALATIACIISRLCKSYLITAAKSAWHAMTQRRPPISCQHPNEQTQTGVIKWDSKIRHSSSNRSILSISYRYRTHWRIWSLLMPSEWDLSMQLKVCRSRNHKSIKSSRTR